MANSQYEGIRLRGAALRVVAVMVRFPRARTPHPRHPRAGHLSETAAPWWPACRRGRVVVAQASDPDQQSLPTPRPESDHARSRAARTGHAVREPTPNSETRRTHLAGHTFQVPPGVGGAARTPAF